MFLINCGGFFLFLFGLIKTSECKLFFPTNSAFGIFAAIAVPLDLPHRNVFVSYNFEANYNYPSTWGIPPIFNGIQDGRKLSKVACSNCTASSEEDQDQEATTLPPLEGSNDENKRNRRSLFTREHFYHILKDKFERTGYKGEDCLLRLICEINASELGDINGVLGSLIHIMFSPSTSQNEELSLRYYQAEFDGINDHCAHYQQTCRENILDLISKPVHDLSMRN